MAMPFNADEVFEMAEQIERNGAEFYRSAAEKLSEMREVFLELAEMEAEHLRTFQDMRDELSAAEQEPVVFDPDDEAQMYLRVMADGRVFDLRADPTEKLTGKETVDDILRMAIGLERDSIVFYVGLKEAVSRQAGKDRVQAIIKEEMSHIAALSERLSALK